MNHTSPEKTSSNEGYKHTDRASLQPDPPRSLITTEVAPVHQHHAAFTFPKLNLDGSLDDLATTLHYSPTPPAALSGRGARAKMADDTLSETSIDSQYDMIDDISDISNDEHETASISSTQQGDGELTPEESVVDLQEERDGTTPAPNTGVVQVENQLLDSFLSEDLETPRQSYAEVFRSHGSSSTSTDTTFPQRQSLNRTRRVLFVSEAGVSDDDISDICLRIASCLLPEGEAIDRSIARSVRLPPRPSKPSASSSLLVRMGEMEFIVDQQTTNDICKQTVESIISVPDLTEQGEKEARHSDLVIYYIQTDRYPRQFDQIKRYLCTTSPPAITIGAPHVDFDTLGEDDTEQVYESDLVFTHEAFFHEDEEDSLRTDIQKLLCPDQIVSLPTRNSGGCGNRFLPRSRQPQTMYEKLLYRLGIGGYPSPLELCWKVVLPIVAILLALASKPYLDLWDDAVLPVPAINLRKDALSATLVKHMNLTDVEVARTFNLSHLLPYPETSSLSFAELFPSQVRYQGAAPNHILVSLPKKPISRRYPTVSTTSVQRSNKALDHNITQLIDGILDINIKPEDAYGRVVATLLTANPPIHVTVEHNFGNKMLRRQTYEKASMEISKAVNKDMMIARKNVKSVSDKVGLELSAGAAATKNVTSELAVYITRDLQVLANTAVSVFVKAVAASSETAAVAKKELAVACKDLIKLSKDVQKSLISTNYAAKALIPSMSTLSRPLVTAKNRALRISKLIARSKRTNGTSATKEIALRLQSIFKPHKKHHKAAARFAKMARSSRSKAYEGYRKAQKALASWTSTAAIRPVATTKPVMASTARAASQSSSTKTYDIKADGKTRKRTEKKGCRGEAKKAANQKLKKMR